MFELPKLDVARTEKNIEEFIKYQVENSKKDGVVLGISGGLDSACVAAQSARILGPGRVLGVLMPDGTQDVSDSFKVVRKLGIKHDFKPITDVVEAYRKTLNIDEKDVKELGNIKARARMTSLYYYANKHNKLVIGTGDKSEILVGYFTKYGDGGTDMLPIGNVYKTQVRELSKEIGVPECIINKPSSPGLWDGQTAEGELGIRYEELDGILYNLVDRGLEVEEVEHDQAKVKYVQNMIKKSQHKRAILPRPNVIYYERI